MQTKIKFHASSVGKLMVGSGSITGERLTEKEQTELKALHEKAYNFANDIKVNNRKVSDLTDNQKAKIIELEAKKTKPFEFGQTALSYIKSVWLRNEYSFHEPVFNNQLMKGLMTENECMDLLSEARPVQEFRVKNQKTYENEFFVGTPDLVLKSLKKIEDIKSCWSIKTFFDAKNIENIYYTQGEVYMDLLEFENFECHKCLVSTPPDIILDEMKSFYFKFGCDEENKDYIKICKQIEKNHDFDNIPAIDRVKTFKFSYNEPYMKELKARVVLANEVYQSFTLNPKPVVEVTLDNLLNQKKNNDKD